MLGTYAGLFYCFLYLPILLLVLLSFNDSQTIGLPFQGVTLRWYREVLGSPDMIRSILNSVLLASRARASERCLRNCWRSGSARNSRLRRC